MEFLARPVVRYPLCYILITLFFSSVYWVAFSVNIESFNFDARFNTRPIELFRSFVFGVDDKIDAVTGRNTQDYSAAMINVLREREQTQDEISRSSMMLAELGDKASSLLDDLIRSRDQEVEDYKAEKIEPLEARLAEIEARFPEQSLDPIADAEEMSKLRKERYLHISFIVENYTSFGDKTIVKKLNSIEQERQQLSKIAFSLTYDIGTLNKKAHDIWKKSYEFLREKYRWIDFVYFSLCVSTTATFGDIIPNTSYMRLAVALQLFMQIVVLSMFLSALYDGGRALKNPIK